MGAAQDFLRERDGEEVQGYLDSRTRPAAEMATRLQQAVTPADR